MQAATFIFLTKDARIIFRPLSLEIPLTTSALLYYVSILEETKFPLKVFLDNIFSNPVWQMIPFGHYRRDSSAFPSYAFDNFLNSMIKSICPHLHILPEVSG